MRNISQLVVGLALLASQVNVPEFTLANVAAAAEPSGGAAGVYEVKLNTNSASPVEISLQKPDYDKEVLAPLRAAQAAKLAASKRRVRRVTTTIVRAKAPATAENMLKLRYCEAGNIYTRNSGNGYYGAYQYNLGTWGNWMGYARPDLAPAAVQDAKFMETYARRGWSPWPSCARKLGFM